MASLTTTQVMERFNIGSDKTVLELFRKKGSPAYKIGTGRGHWRVDEDDFKKYLQRECEKDKS